MDFIKNRKIFYVISALFILTGIVFYFINGFNYGIDFTGGTVFEIHADSQLDSDELMSIFKPLDNTSSVVYSGEQKQTAIVKSTKDFNSKEVADIKNQLKEKFGIEKEKISNDTTGATMGRETRQKALTSILIAGALMLVYITIRFEFKFGLASVCALLHDVLVTLACYSIFQLPFNSSLIAAILTIVGYSINATIIIFDRIREEKKFMNGRTIEQVINESINKTLRRTIITTVTTVLAVVTLYYVGVEAVKILALPLLIGLLAGSYSSLFLASSFWYDFSKKSFKK
ncbi:MAG: protein translocase subunit SecF [Ezakiella massiliensis]|uniref:protein translocase subunit SecF n=1 Tax=Ezakiella massiliensis TaxID=1852374 RepID=UPI00094E971F|nr:protein translocase subunit SecF [Ezakiella massiliensis]